MGSLYLHLYKEHNFKIFHSSQNVKALKGGEPTGAKTVAENKMTKPNKRL